MSNLEQPEPVIGTNMSPVGSQMNCNSWGTYEAPGTSETAALCSGGTVDGEMWGPCPSRDACRAAKQQRVLTEARDRAAQGARLPVYGQPQSTVRVVGGQGMPNMPRPMTTGMSPGTTLPQRPVGAPATIVTPETTNPYLATQRILSPTRAGMHSPTFLPKKKEGWMLRLGKNMLQGMFNAFGWHMHDFTSNVDLFPHDDED